VALRADVDAMQASIVPAKVTRLRILNRRAEASEAIQRAIDLPI